MGKDLVVGYPTGGYLTKIYLMDRRMYRLRCQIFRLDVLIGLESVGLWLW
jgi:hypothetical protein